MGCPPTSSGQTAGTGGQEEGPGKRRCCGLTHANCAGDVGGVAGFAGAAVGTRHVEALTVLAQVSHHTTLVNVWMETRESECQINGPTGKNPACQEITESPP